jgi:nucleoside-diphosphate-sugar epimerase
MEQMAEPKRTIERALVTGGAGFIGSTLVRELVRRKVYVRVLDNLSSGDDANLEGLGGKIEFQQGDVRNAIACRNACRGMDTVFHFAALVSVPQSVADPVTSDAINCGGTLNLLIAARDSQVKRFVFSSSAAVYGDTQTVPTPEKTLPFPTSPYGLQKLTGEHYARNFLHHYGLEAVSLRYFNVYGPRQNPNSAYAAVIPKFFTRLAAGEGVTVFGDGEQTRDFCHVRDVVAANLLAAETLRSEALGASFNVACGERISVNELLALMQETTGSSINAAYCPERPGDIKHSGADIRRAKSVLRYRPKVAFAEGLSETWAYYKSLPAK